MISKPLDAANEIFQESLGAIMAHTIRGTQNYFRRHLVSLELVINADANDILALEEPRAGVTSILKTRLLKTPPGVPDVVKAAIYLHKHANRTLARVSVAHEIFHLLLELHVYLTTMRKEWKRVAVTKDIEDQCNQFAWELCHEHEVFNRHEGVRNDYIFFPKDFFAKPFNTNATFQAQWPPGMAIDAAHPFTERPALKYWKT